jgi:serine/threonine protein phosphatase PrpC
MPQCTLAMFSDGIFEIMEGENLQEKETRLLNMVNKPQMSIEDILISLGVKMEGGGPDDITLLLMNRNVSCKHVNK